VKQEKKNELPFQTIVFFPFTFSSSRTHGKWREKEKKREKERERDFSNNQNNEKLSRIEPRFCLVDTSLCS
jgi:hypothetical protein